MNKKQLINKLKLKQISINAFISDECDNIPVKSKSLFTGLINSIYIEIDHDIEQLDLSKKVNKRQCFKPSENSYCNNKLKDSSCLKCKYYQNELQNK